MRHRVDRCSAVIGLLAAGGLLASCGSSDAGPDFSPAGPAATSAQTPTGDGAGAVDDRLEATSEAQDSDALIRAALDGGEPVVCDRIMEDGIAAVTYIGGPAAIRVDKDDDVVGEITVLIANQVAYVWGPGDTVSAAFEPALAAELDLAPDLETLFDDDRQIDCARYDGDEAVFEVPEGVEFTTIDTEGRLVSWLIDDLTGDEPSAFALGTFARMSATEQAEVTELTGVVPNLPGD